MAGCTGALNGVDLVLVPLLGTGLIQPVQSFVILSTGPVVVARPMRSQPVRLPPFVQCIPHRNRRPDGAPRDCPEPDTHWTLPQPIYPGLQRDRGRVALANHWIRNFRPNVVDSFDFTVQRQLSRKMTLEFGYIGRRITHEYQPININAVPYMMTLGGQQFDQAYKNVVLQYLRRLSGAGWRRLQRQ